MNFARDHHLPLAIRSGGHNVAGYAVCDAGVMIDMTLMNGVRLSPALDRAFVEGGAHWLDVDAATTAFNRATPGGLISGTGVAGLTLSGGIGWLRGRHGLSCDNLVGADVVTADGRLVHCSDSENPDLLWGLRGGGGNFGVVVNFEFKLHAIDPELFFCAPIYPEERANEILPKWRDFMASAPEGLSGLAEFSTTPHDEAYPENTWGRRVVALAHVYDGPADDGIIHDITAQLAKRPSEMIFASIWKFGGAMQRVSPDATAFGDRSAPFMLSLDAIWSDARDDAANIAWARNAWDYLQRHSTGRLYLNFPGLGEDQSLVKNALGKATFARLQQVKRQYDPHNLFRLNQNIQPG